MPTYTVKNGKVTIPLASATADGIMSKDDKAKLDKLTPTPPPDPTPIPPDPTPTPPPGPVYEGLAAGQTVIKGPSGTQTKEFNWPVPKANCTLDMRDAYFPVNDAKNSNNYLKQGVSVSALKPRTY